MSSEMQKVGNVTFRIVDRNVDMGFVWKDGVLYLTLHNVMLTDGNIWYEIPIKDLKNIEADDGSISFVVESMTLTMKGRNAERLMALRHLLLPLIDGERNEKNLTESIVKLMLIGIKDPEVMASLMRIDAGYVRKAMEDAEKSGLISGGELTEKGRMLIPEEDRAVLEDAEVSE